MECHVEIVVDRGRRALNGDVGADGLGHAEQLQRLVDQVRAEVAEHAATGLRLLAPARLDLRPEAVPMRFEQHDLAKARQDVANGEVIRIPAPVVEHAEHALALLGQGDQLVRFLQRNSERLVDHDVPPRFERAFRDREVRAVGGRYDNEVRAIDQLVERPHARGRITRGKDRAQLHPLARADQRRMKHRPRQAIADKPDSDHRATLRGTAALAKLGE